MFLFTAYYFVFRFSVIFNVLTNSDGVFLPLSLMKIPSFVCENYALKRLSELRLRYPMVLISYGNSLIGAQCNAKSLLFDLFKAYCKHI